MRKGTLLDIGPDALGDSSSFFSVGLRQEDRKFFSAESRGNVCTAQRVADNVSDHLQRRVARGMAELVVIRFEMIDVEHHKTHRKTVTVRAFDLFQKALFDITSIQKSRKSVRSEE